MAGWAGGWEGPWDPVPGSASTWLRALLPEFLLNLNPPRAFSLLLLFIFNF